MTEENSPKKIKLYWIKHRYMKSFLLFKTSEEGYLCSGRRQRRNLFSEKPQPPFITSSLQQEAIKKLRWTAKRTMSVAQKLYENGWITYMRTDSTTLSEQAIKAARSFISSDFGNQYLPKQPRVYTSKSKMHKKPTKPFVLQVNPFDIISRPMLVWIKMKVIIWN